MRRKGECLIITSAEFTPVAGLAEAVSLRRSSPRLSYGEQCAEVTESLVRAEAYEHGSVLLELRNDEALPKRLRGREVPVIMTVPVELSPGRTVTEKALSAFAAPRDAEEETKRRGHPVRVRTLSVSAFLEYAEACGISVLFSADGCRFPLIRSQFPYIRSSAVQFAAEEVKRKKKERAALRAAFLKEKARLKALGSESPDDGSFRPMDNVTAAVNADLTDARRAELAVSFLKKNAAGPDESAVFVVAKPEDELPAFLRGYFIPRIERIRIGKYEKNAMTVLLSDKIPPRERTENILCSPCRRCGANELLELVWNRKCAVRIISGDKELVIPFRYFAEESLRA